MVVIPAARKLAQTTLQATQVSLSGKLAGLVASWPKYAEGYEADPTGFAEIQTAVLVGYIAAMIGDADENYRHLYIGEKVKQFHDPSVTAEEKLGRERTLLKAERALFFEAVAHIPFAAAEVSAAFDAIEYALTAPARSVLNVLFVGDCLYLDVLAFLTAPSLADGIRLIPTFVTSHAPAEVLAHLARLSDQHFDVIFFSPFSYAFIADYEALQRAKAVVTGKAGQHIRGAVAAGETMFDSLADLFDCPIVLHLPATFMRHSGSARERLEILVTAPARGAAVRSLRASLKDNAEARNAAGQVILVIDERNLIAEVGAFAAGRFLYRSFLQHPARFGVLVAEYYRDIVFVVAWLLKRKLVACDLDNTLWKGVIGEGLGIEHHYDRQAPLLELKRRGVVLAINSKNNPAKAVWDALPDRLSLDDFVSRQINWDPKSINMNRIAEHLNLKPKDFVFVDDRADERAMVQERFPEMMTLDAEDSQSWRLFDLWAKLLPAKTGADRTDFYRQRDARQSFIANEAESSARERSALYEQLGLELVIREAGPEDVSRVTELINRTNQFNMAGTRITRRRVEDLVAHPDARVLIADAADRFGAMGTISVLIAEQQPDQVVISTFVLSCRVFGYAMEYAIIEALCSAIPAGVKIAGAFEETPHNQPCHAVYPQAGFHRVDGGWLRDENASPITVAEWLKVDVSIRPIDTVPNDGPFDGRDVAVAA